MKIPSQIQVGPIIYTIKFHPEDFNNSDEERMVANINFRDSVINISEDMGDQMVDLSFLHEVQHAIDYAMGYLTGDDDDPLSFESTERNVEARAQLMLQVINQLLDYNEFYDDFEEADTVLNIARVS